MILDLQFAFVIDAKATEHVLHRQGTDRMKHSDAAHVWLQGEARSNSLKVCRVRSAHHVADLGTKALGWAVSARHLGDVNLQDSQSDIGCNRGVATSKGNRKSL